MKARRPLARTGATAAIVALLLQLFQPLGHLAALAAPSLPFPDAVICTHGDGAAPAKPSPAGKHQTAACLVCCPAHLAAAFTPPDSIALPAPQVVVVAASRLRSALPILRDVFTLAQPRAPPVVV